MLTQYFQSPGTVPVTGKGRVPEELHHQIRRSPGSRLKQTTGADAFEEDQRRLALSLLHPQVQSLETEVGDFIARLTFLLALPLSARDTQAMHVQPSAANCEHSAVP